MITVASSESIPGVKIWKRWGAHRFTTIWATNKKPPRTKIFFLVNLDLAIPHPARVTNRGAASPPSPDTMNARMLVLEIVVGVHVAAAWTITIRRMAIALTWSGCVRRPVVV